MATIKPWHINDILREAFPRKELKMKHSYELSRSQTTPRLSVFVDEDAVGVSASRESAPPHLRFLNPQRGGKSPFTWNALQHIAFAIDMEHNPSLVDECPDDLQPVCHFLINHDTYDLVEKPIHRRNDCDQDDFAHIHMSQEANKVYVDTRSMRYQNGEPAFFFAPSPGESRIMWNALALLAQGILLDNSHPHVLELRHSHQ